MMTSEKAIQLLHRLSDEQFDGIHGDERREALEMAVRALEPNLGQKTIDCIISKLNDEDRTTGDCISRKMAIDAVNIAYTMTEVVNNRPVNDCEQELYYRIRRELSKLPSAQPQRKKGEWEQIFDGMTIKVRCTNCKTTFSEHNYFRLCEIINEAKHDLEVCPSCGARMDGESDG